MSVCNPSFQCAVGIGTLPTATSKREYVAVLVVYAVIVIMIAAFFPQARAGTVIVNAFGTHTQIYDSLVVGIEVESELFLIFQIIVEREFEVNIVLSYIRLTGFVVHDICSSRYLSIGGTYNDVITRHIAIVCTCVVAIRGIGSIVVMGSLPLLISRKYQLAC